MAQFKIKVVVKDDRKEIGDTELPEKKKSDEVKEQNWEGVAKQAVGYIPGASQAMSVVGTANALATGGMATAVGLALSLAKKAYDEVYEWKKNQRDSAELTRRAGLTETYRRR